MNFILFSSLSFIFFLCFSFSAHGEHVIGPKIGYVKWGTNSVNVAGSNIQFDDVSTSSLGVEYLFILNKRLHIGGEFIYEDLEPTTGLQTADDIPFFQTPRNDINVYRYTGVANYYFQTGDFFKPYIGLGLGSARMGIHARNSATLKGYTYMYKLGFNTRFSRRIGLAVEYRNAYISMDDAYGNQMKSRNNEYFIGLNIYFGAVKK